MTVTKEQQLRDALRRAYHFGQTYWQQADSESYAQNKRADETAAKFAWHVDETVRQFIEQSQDRGHAPAPTDEVLRYVKGYLEGRDDWIGIEDLIGDIDRALAAPAPTEAVQQPPIEECPELNLSNYDAVDVERLNDWAIRADALIAALSGASPTPQPELTLVPRAFLQGFLTLAHNYSLNAEAPNYYHDVERDAFSNAYRRCGNDLAKLRSLLGAAPTQAPQQPKETALERFKACQGDEEIDPIERLRFFCSCAMSGQDWLDVEPFFDALSQQPTPSPTAQEPVAFSPLLAFLAKWEDENGSLAGITASEWAELREPIQRRACIESPRMTRSRATPTEAVQGKENKQ